MTTSTTKHPPPGARSDETIELPSARKTQPGLAVAPTSSGSALESRIVLRRAELIGKLGELRADTRASASEARDRMKARLSELAHIIKEGVVDGWTSVGDTVKHKLEHWLAESERSLSTQELSAKNE